MTDSPRLKTELGRIRGAIMSGSFDRDTALDALDKAEKALDAATPPAVPKPVTPAPAPAKPLDFTKPATTTHDPAHPANS